MKVYLDTIGCRLNQSEIETYARQLRFAGHTLVGDPADADLAIVNTCTVTTAASADSRKKIRHIARQGVGEIVVTGCWSSLHPDEAAALPKVSTVVPNTGKDALVAQIFSLPLEIFDSEPLEREPIPGARLRTRAFIKAQDGCDNRCTFCITTIARGESRSRNEVDILRDVEAALRGGSREIVLTGVHLGAWGHDLVPRRHLADLVRFLLHRTDVPRLRLSSIEPWDLDEAFFSLWEDKRMARHLHLPLQSGSASTLRRMARKTTPEAYARLLETAREAIPGVAITTDVIVGFPGESDTEFNESLEFVRQMNFAGGHVFTYSERPGTAAANMAGQVPHALRKERNAQMRAVFTESAQRYRQQFVGKQLDVLWESTTRMGPQTWTLHGLSDNYLRITAEAPKRMWNQITAVQLTGLDDDGLVGYICL